MKALLDALADEAAQASYPHRLALTQNQTLLLNRQAEEVAAWEAEFEAGLAQEDQGEVGRPSKAAKREVGGGDPSVNLPGVLGSQTSFEEQMRKFWSASASDVQCGSV